MSTRKLKNEHELLKEAIKVGTRYAEKRGVVKFEPTDSQELKVEYLYKLLVHDQLMQPLAKPDLSLPNMKHKLALWIEKQLPGDHPLKQ